jgi:hypothetical protein
MLKRFVRIVPALAGLAVAVAALGGTAVPAAAASPYNCVDGGFVLAGSGSYVGHGNLLNCTYYGVPATAELSISAPSFQCPLLAMSGVIRFTTHPYSVGPVGSPFASITTDWTDVKMTAAVGEPYSGIASPVNPAVVLVSGGLGNGAANVALDYPIGGPGGSLCASPSSMTVSHFSFG